MTALDQQDVMGRAIALVNSEPQLREAFRGLTGAIERLRFLAAVADTITNVAQETQ